MFQVYNPLRERSPETYILEEWETVRSDAINAWIGFLKNGFPNNLGALVAQEEAYAVDNSFPPAVTIYSVCPYDTDNLRWSGKAITASVTIELLEGLEKTLGTYPTGPEYFFAVIGKLQQTNSSASQTLFEELKGMSLIKYPGKYVDAFGDCVVELFRQISGVGAEPENLSIIAATNLLECDVIDFSLKVSDLHGNVDDNTTSLT